MNQDDRTQNNSNPEGDSKNFDMRGEDTLKKEIPLKPSSPDQPLESNQSNVSDDAKFQNTVTGSDVSDNSALDQRMEEVIGQKKKHKFPIFVVLLLVLVFLFSSTIGLFALISNDIIPMKNEALKYQMADLYYALPFIPKPPAYLLHKSILAHAEVKSAYIEALWTSDSDYFRDYLDIDEMNFTLKGPIDISDKTNPRVLMNMSSPGDIDVDYLYVDEEMYIKLNNLPSFMKSSMNISSDEDIAEFLNTWILLPSDTSFSMEKEDEKTDDFEFYSDLSKRVFDEKLAPIIQKSEEQIDGTPAYKLSTDLDYKLLGEIQDMVEDEMKNKATNDNKTDFHPPRTSLGDEDSPLKNVQLELWLDKKDYYLRKAAFNFTLEFPDISTDIYTEPVMFQEDVLIGSLNPLVLGVESIRSQKEISMSLVVNVTGINEKFDISAPDSFENMEDFYYKIYTRADSIAGERSQLYSEILQLESAVNMYYVDNNGKYPENIALLQGPYVIGELKNINYHYLPDTETALAYIYDFGAEDPEKPYYHITFPTEYHFEKENFLSREELRDLLLSHGIDAEIYEPLLEEETIDPTSSDEGFQDGVEDESPFGRMLD